jgi:hypothetical protein
MKDILIHTADSAQMGALIFTPNCAVDVDHSISRASEFSKRPANAGHEARDQVSLAAS